MRRPTFLKTHEKILRHRPLIVGTIAGPHSVNEQIQLARRTKPDLVEIRLDTLPVRAFQEIRAKTKLPVLLTIRSPRENGGKAAYHDLSEADRRGLFQFLIPLSDMIDVELRHEPLIKALTPLARAFNVDVMHSAHDFHGIGTEKRLQTLAKRSQRLRGDVFKAAVMPKTDVELEKFLDWGLKLDHPCRVLIGMGAAGLPSRFMGYSMGSVFAYGHLGRSAAPGQPSVADLKNQIHRIYREA